MTKLPPYLKKPLKHAKGETTRFVMLNDVHVPENLPLEGVFSFIESFKPHHVILNGDIMNMNSLSHWVRDVPRQWRSKQLPTEEYEIANELFYTPLKKASGKGELTHVIGNHEAWAFGAIDREPDGEGFWEPQLNIKHIDNWVEQFGIAKLGKIHFLHGDVLKCNGKVAAQRLLDLYRRNVRAGHWHGLYEASDSVPIDIKDRHTARVCGTLEKFNPSYMKNRPHSWIYAFTYGYVDSNGCFWDETVKINDGIFYANGKRWKL